MPGPKKEEYPEEEARRRFERAVDAALRSPPMHREPKNKATKDDAPRRRIRAKSKKA